MPSKNTVRCFIENGYYHVYNRGVEKRQIFLDKQDCAVFLHYLKMYLSPIEELYTLQKNISFPIRIQRYIPKNLSKEIDLLSFSLMSNHIHLELKQYTKNAITKLMRQVLIGYVMYFNYKYQRVGSLFQNKYKAANIKSDEYLLHLSRYIHINSSGLKKEPINFAEFSSYSYYLGTKQASWVKPQEILNYFKSPQRLGKRDVLSYQSFVEDYQEDSISILGDLTLEDEF